ncbi:MAG: VWA domain-containing protein [Thermodesulfobacteriota bacterium]
MDFLPPHFHFLRPFWLLAAIPGVLLFLVHMYLRASASRWDKAIDRSLLPHLLDGDPERRQRWPLLLLLFVWLLTSLAVAGPVWEKLPGGVQKKEDGLVLIQDLSLSFYAGDLSPNRLARAHHKLLDILESRKEGTTALIVYSADAHLVAPLTDDTNTIAAMVPDLSPSIMPGFGSNLPEAVGFALQLFRDTGISQGKLLLLTDEVDKEDGEEVARLLRGKNVVLSILGVGTEDGGPIPRSDGGFLEDEQGNIIVPRLNRSLLVGLASGSGGRYSDIRLDDSDINYLLGAEPLIPEAEGYRQIDREFDQWREQGHWLLVLIIPLALLSFRRGWLLGLVLVLSFWSTESQAMGRQDLWLSKDQQGARSLAANEPEKAAGLFKSRKWRGAAEYRAGNYAKAAAAFGGSDQATDLYNRGNALAKAGQLAEAAKVYETVLKLDPEMADARFNKDLVEKIMKQQEQQQKDGESGEQGQQDQQAGEKGDDSKQTNGGEQQDGSEGADSDRKEDSADSSDDPGKEQRGDDKDGEEEQNRQARDDAAEDQEGESLSGAKETESGEKAQDGQLEGQPSGEEQQALEQWLRRIPDNPGGLLRRKFEYESRDRKDRGSKSDKKIW